MDILTQRLRLRPVRNEDADELFRLWNLPEIRRYLHGSRPVTRTTVLAEITDSERRFASAGYGLWAAFPVAGGPLLGSGGFRRLMNPPRTELSYAIDRPWRGQGYATEMAGELVRRGFEDFRLDRLEAAADADNAASLRVLGKLGFMPEARLWEQGRDLVVHRLTRKEWERGRRAVS